MLLDVTGGYGIFMGTERLRYITLGAYVDSCNGEDWVRYSPVENCLFGLKAEERFCQVDLLCEISLY